MTALRGMRCGYYPGLSTWVQCNHKSPYKEGGRKVRGREEVTMEAKVREGGGEREREEERERERGRGEEEGEREKARASKRERKNKHAHPDCT